MSYASQIPLIGHVISWFGLVEDWKIRRMDGLEWLDAPDLFGTPEIEIRSI